MDDPGTPLGPLPTRIPSPDPSRDTAPPRPATRVLAYPEQAPNNLPDEGKTPATFLVTAPYVKRKFERMEEQQQRSEKRRNRSVIAALGGLATALTGLAGLFEHFHEQREEERQAKTEQRLADHIDSETEHHKETTKRLDQLLELELKRGHQ